MGAAAPHARRAESSRAKHPNSILSICGSLHVPYADMHSV